MCWPSSPAAPACGCWGNGHQRPAPGLPPPDSPPTPTVLQEIPAVALFVERAEAVRDDFAMTAENAGAVARLCAQLEGLPLAIELAAARSDQFSPAAMLTRLEDRLALLAGGPRDAPPRHRSLRAAIQWSYDLLTADEQAVFACLAVFAGSFTLAAAGAVCERAEAPALDVAEAIATLAEHSLLTAQPHEGEPRYAMLEEHPAVCVGSAGSLERHGAGASPLPCVVRPVAEEAAQGLTTEEQGDWLRRLRLEQDNLRHALTQATGAADAGEAMLRLASSLVWFWHAQGQLTEGRVWLETALAQPATRPGGATWARACYGAGVLARDQGDYLAARAWLEQSASAWRALGAGPDLTNVLEALRILSRLQGGVTDGAARSGTNPAAGAATAEAGANTAETAAWLAYASGAFDAAREQFETVLAISRAGHRLVQTAALLTNLGHVALAEGDHAAAERAYGEALPLTREAGSLREMAYCLNGLGEVARSRGAYQEAAKDYARAGASSIRLATARVGPGRGITAGRRGWRWAGPRERSAISQPRWPTFRRWRARAAA